MRCGEEMHGHHGRSIGCESHHMSMAHGMGIGHGMHGCCCGGRKFLSKKEKIEMLEDYRESLQNELEGLEEELKKLKSEL